MENLSLDKACFIIVKAREFDVKVPPIEPDPGSNPIDDRGVSVIEDYPDDATQEELIGALESLNAGEMAELLALVWLGRGDYVEWNEATQAAEEQCDENVIRYLIGTPLLGDYIEEGLSQLGFSCSESEDDIERIPEDERAAND